MKSKHDQSVQNVVLELSAVIVAIVRNEPMVMIVPPSALPSGPLGERHRTLEQGLRAWVKTQSDLDVGYVEQLYTFADKDRTINGKRVISIGYLALTRAPNERKKNKKFVIEDWYKFFPWEDRRAGTPQPVTAMILQGLTRWKNKAPDAATRRAREQRIAINFPKEPRDWNEEFVLQRYELMWEAELIAEACAYRDKPCAHAIPSLAMAHDHRRILATGMARLRAKIKYHPVVFELLPSRFTLLHLQSTVEALAGLRLHKQNFRRRVQAQKLVEETKALTNEARGRPAKIFAFRREVLRKRAVAGTKLPSSS